MGIPLLVSVGDEVWDHVEAGGGFTARAEDRSDPIIPPTQLDLYFVDAPHPLNSSVHCATGPYASSSYAGTRA